MGVLGFNRGRRISALVALGVSGIFVLLAALPAAIIGNSVDPGPAGTYGALRPVSVTNTGPTTLGVGTKSVGTNSVGAIMADQSITAPNAATVHGRLLATATGPNALASTGADPTPLIVSALILITLGAGVRVFGMRARSGPPRRSCRRWF